MLKRNLRDLEDALYDEDSEATCRIAVDIMLVQCRKYLRNKYRSTETSDNIEATVADATNPLTPKRAVVNRPAVEPIKRVKLFPEASLSIEMCDPFVPHRKILVTGRADWAFGYSTAGEKGALLVAIEAKQKSEFSKGKAQLIAYLAILRENRLKARKTNIITQGFYSDGSQYSFICITADGTVNRSRIFDTGLASDLKMVFNFIITMMETAMKSTPNASPTKPGQLQEKEVSHFESEVWLKVFTHVEESIVVGSDDDMEDVIDLS